jgi:hypothetical protein
MSSQIQHRMKPQCRGHSSSFWATGTAALPYASQHDYQLPPDVALQLETRHWFPPAFLPYLAHPVIQAAGSACVARLSANHLVHFLDYTTLLEHRIVNRAVETIVHGELPAYVPTRMKNAALQLYTDEGYHALFSNQLAEQIAAFYGITGRPVMPLRITRLNALIARTPETTAHWHGFCWVSSRKPSLPGNCSTSAATVWCPA